MGEPIKTEVVEEDEIDLKEVVKTITKHKIGVIFFTILFTAGAFVFQYFKPDIYEAYSSVELPLENKARPQSNDLLMNAFGLGTVNIENEIEIFRSTFLVQKTLQRLNNVSIRYFVKNGLLKRELYRNTPFVVDLEFTDKRYEGLVFKLLPKDDRRYHIVVDTASNWLKKILHKTLGRKDELEIKFEKDVVYGKKLVTPWFTLKIEKIRNLTAPEYCFVKDSLYDQIKRIKENLSVSAAGKESSIISIKFQDNIRKRAIETTAALVDAYLEQEKEYKTKNTDEALKFIDSQLAQMKEVLNSSGKKLESFKSENTLVNLSEKASMTAEKMSEYETKLQQLEIEENILKNLLYYIKSNKNIEGLTMGSVQMSDPALIKSIEQLQSAILRRKSLLVSFTELHPEVVSLTETINNLKKNILFLIKNDLNSIAHRKQALKKILNDYKKSLKRMPQQEQKLANLLADYQVNQKIYAYLLEKRTELAISKTADISTARIIDKADADKKPVKPKRLLIIVVGLILGIIIGVFYAFVREFMKNTIESAEDVERITALPLYGSLPWLQKNKKNFNVFMEAARTLRTNIFFSANKKKGNTITVTSSMPGEGKTTVSKVLSVIIARSEKSVVVIDADMRRARLAQEFGLKPQKRGLSSYLAGQHESIDEIMMKIEKENVWLIPAGPKPPNPSELIVSDRMNELIAKLQEAYDYVIIDTPPVGLVTDGFLLMEKSDLSLMVVKANFTRKEALKHFDKYVRLHGLKHIGIILNGVKGGGAYGYGGYGYGGYGYGAYGSKSKEYYTNA